MIEPEQSTIILLIYLVFAGVILPILARIPVVKSVVSYRWFIVVTMLSLLLGVILDFSHITDSIRLTVILGASIIAGLYMLIRTWEKAQAHQWKIDLPTIKAEKGDIKVEITDDKTDKKEGSSDN